MPSDGPPNVYRDEKYLVIPVNGAVFPNRCIKTNQNVRAADFLVILDLEAKHKSRFNALAEDVAKMVAEAAVGEAEVITFLTKQRLYFHIGLNPERQATERFRELWGLRLMACGALFGFAFPILAMLFLALNPAEWITPETSGILMLMCMLTGLVAIFTGLTLFILHRLLLRVIKSNGKHVWLTGSHEEFLATLPELPKT